MPSSSVTLAASIYAVGVKVASKTLVIHADSCGTVGFAWLNDKQIAIGDELKLSSNVICKQTSVRQYKCTASSEFYLVIDMYDGHLSVQSWTNKCAGTRGLFGPCGSDGAVNDFLTSGGSTLDPDADLNVKNIYETFAASWKADKGNSMFSVVFPNSDPASAETCLRTTAGHAISETVYTFTKAEVTVEIKFYLENDVVDCATLWSYHNTETFSVLICNGYVNIYHNKQKIALQKLKRIRAETWYHLSTVWGDEAAEINVYLLLEDKAYESDSTPFAQSPLIPGGKFMIGQMYYDSTMDLEVLSWNLNGYFDEFTIWKKPLDLNFVINNAFSYKEGTEDGLSTLWRFNEGYGTVSLDSSDLQLKMEWVPGPRAHPEWTVCGYVMEYPVLTQRSLSSILNTNIIPEVEKMCSSLLQKTGLRTSVTEAAWLKLNQQCRFNVYSLGDRSRALEVILALVDAYMVREEDRYPNVRAKLEWPGRVLCQDFQDSFPGWTGENCGIYCLSGEYDDTSKECLCSLGFWSTDCDQICPYARDSPCGGGTCNKGDCTCTLDRYDGTKGCKRCSDGWIGTDCSSTSADLSAAVKRMGMIFSLGHIIMFDGQGYDVHTPGQFIIMDKHDVGLYARMKPRGANVCVQQMWLRVDGHQFTIQTPLIDNDKLIFWHNNAMVEITDSYTITGDVVLAWEDQASMTISLISYGNLIIRVTYLGLYLDLQVIFDAATCSAGVSGLLGNCDKNVDNDFYSTESTTIAHHEVSQDIIDTSHVNKFVQEDSTGFVYTYPDLSTLEPVNIENGYSLLFNKWGIMSAPIPQAVFDGTKNITFDIKMKLLSENGLILGYNVDSKFSLFVENLKLKLWAFRQIYDTNFIFAKDQWCHIFVSHDVISDNVTVSIFINNTLKHQHRVTIPNLTFPSGGYFMLGYWQVAPPTDFGKLFGMIGTLRVWEKILDDYVMFDASITHIVTGYENLVLLFEFSEGFGYTTTDSVNDISMSLPKTGEVTWFITDLPQVPKASEECKTESETISRSSANKDKCLAMLKSELLTSACVGLGADFSKSYFYDACLTDDRYVSSLKAYIDLCTTIIVLTNFPIVEICADGTSEHYQCVCAEFCKFGVPSKSGCECYKGYWGETCDKVCPGGSHNPCYGHGICNVTTGVCDCFKGFSASDDCKVCDPMYMEPSCSVRYPPAYNPIDNTVDDTGAVNTLCSVSSEGYVINYMQVSYIFNHIGQFYLVRADSGNDQVPNIQICTASCYHGRICITAVYFEYKSESVSVQGAASAAKDIVITVNDMLQYSSTTTTGLQNLAIESTTKTHTIIRSLDDEMSVFVTHSSTDARYLQVVVKILGNTNNCLNQLSMCGNCTKFTFGTEVHVYDESWVVLNGSRCVASTADGTESGSTTGIGGSGGFAISFTDITVVNGTGSTADANGTRVSTDILKNVITNDNGLTISMKIKPENDTGTIFTYSENTVFDAFLDDGVLKFAVGNEIHDSNITITTDEWHHISLVWSDVTQQMIVYATPMANGSETQNALFTVPKETFNDYGTLTLGSYNPPFNSAVTDPIKQDFVGKIDEFFVVSRTLEASEEAQFRYDAVPLDEDGLKLYYNFDSVDTNVIPDLVSGNDLTAETLPWEKWTVAFTPSDLPIEQSPPDDLSGVAMDSSTTLAAATESCDQYFNNAELITLCGGLLNVDLYRDFCIQTMEVTGNEKTALDTAFLYAENCNLILELENNTLADNPKQYLCGADPVAAGFVGEHCDIPCKFPDPSGDGLNCSCATGYWGIECNQICPGGAENPCNNNGVCEKLTGECICSSNYQGMSCNECANGWLGEDCQVIIQEAIPNLDFFSCSLTSHKHLKTFDGAYLSLDTKQDGTYIFYEDSVLKINVQVGPCSMYSKCVLAIAFETEGIITSIVPQENGVVRYNGVELIIDNSLSLSTQYSLKNPGTAEFLLEGPGGFSVEVSAQPSFLNVFISRQSCPVTSVAEGICGGCGSLSSSTCASNDLLCMISSIGIAETVTNKTDLETAVILDYFNQFHLEYQDSLFAAAGESQITSGYGVTLVSENSYISFPTFVDDVFNSSDARTIEMRAKFETADGGTVFSYTAGEETFGVVIIDGKFVIQYGNETFPSDFAVAVGEWCNIAVSYDVQTGEVLLDYIHGDSHVYAVIDTVGLGALDTGGSLVIGQWGSFKTSPPPGHSVLTVDRVLVWDKALSPNDFENNWEVNKFSEESGLSGIYNMDEGTGLDTKDSLTGNIASIDEASSWTQSDIYIIPESVQVSDSSELVVIDETASTVCGELMQVLMDQCSSLPSLLDNMYKSCFEDVAATGNPDNSIDVALHAAKECSEQLSIDDPLKSSCNDFPTRNFPGWVGDYCDLQCLHGTFTPETGCVCETGYYGASCSDACPGGPVPPCSGHGTCTAEGHCECEPNWSGDSICSSCATKYVPPNCDVLVVEPPETCTWNKCSMSGGSLYQLDCTRKQYEAKESDLIVLNYGEIMVVVSIFHLQLSSDFS